MTTDSTAIGQQQALHQREELTAALRALLMTPLMTPAHTEFAAVRRHADALREWFIREAGWPLHIERDAARLYKRPADVNDATRGLPGYERRRYVLLCLACAVLERADPQITLRVLGDRLLALAADPALAALGFSFTLQAQHERRELVAVCRTLLELGVLHRVAGDEEGFVHGGNEGSDSLHDALYDVQRRVLAGVLAASRGPSTWPADEAPVTLEARLTALVAEPVPDSDEGRRTTLRHHLARRLLDDPVIYLDRLDVDQRAYFMNQRGTMATRLCDATGLVAEQRAEGLALADEDGELTDVAMPAEGTEAHVTLLVAEFLTSRSPGRPKIDLAPVGGGSGDLSEPGALPTARANSRTNTDEVAAFIASARGRFGKFWRKSAREAGSEHELAATALDRLQRLQLLEHDGTGVRPLPALARFAVGEAELRPAAPVATGTLF
ncbi:TIGR02678 family protein [Aromatoleum aromaticum]|uniref:TIGR02678 family protein n=1 Tax=Aromatoleum aromaticum TaxID=551760 RepID=UPI001459F187|nr:TIGR02678 family protein [Aromatoleum aromaticum]NMG55925.1 TIGR02678 family protein [Aromatoleum aromaticum]